MAQACGAALGAVHNTSLRATHRCEQHVAVRNTAEQVAAPNASLRAMRPLARPPVSHLATPQVANHVIEDGQPPLCYSHLKCEGGSTPDVPSALRLHHLPAWCTCALAR
eukprot:364764-Chlamydomonas_euryale.AAC.3